jgi:hypothetical protein
MVLNFTTTTTTTTTTNNAAVRIDGYQEAFQIFEDCANNGQTTDTYI